MIEKKPLVTIVMPCLNEEAYIGRAIRSLLDSWAVMHQCWGAGCQFGFVKWG